MKIKIKSREEIKKTLNKSRYHVDMGGAYFNNKMFVYCGKNLKAQRCSFRGYAARTDCGFAPIGSWVWHPDWYEIIETEYDFTNEDLMDIELMDEMLEYFVSVRNN